MPLSTLYFEPDKPARVDRLRFRAYARALARVIRSMDGQHLGTVIGLYGGWGAGKSTLLRLLSHELQPGPARFDATKKRRQRLWRGIIRAMRHPRGRWRSLTLAFRADWRQYRLLFQAHWLQWWQGIRDFWLQTTPHHYCVVVFDAWLYAKQEELSVALVRKIIRAARELGALSYTRLISNRFLSRLDYAKISIHILALVLRAFVKAVVILLLLVLVTALTLWGLVQLQNPGVLNFVIRLLDWLDGAQDLAVGGTLVLGVATAFGMLWQAMSAVVTIRLDPNLSAFTRRLATEGVTAFVDDLADDMQAILGPLSRRASIVVLIEDLDRCPQAQILPVLEALKAFTAISYPDAQSRLDKGASRGPGLVFLLAADRAIIEQAVESHFAEGIAKGQPDNELKRLTALYLDKIIQLPLTLPPLLAGDLDQLIGPPTGILAPTDLRVIEPAWVSSAAGVYDREVKLLFNASLGANPREHLRAANLFRLHWLVAAFRELGEPSRDQQLTLGMLTLLRLRWPNLYALLAEFPDLLVQLSHFAGSLTSSLDTTDSITRELVLLRCPNSDVPHEVVRTSPALLAALNLYRMQRMKDDQDAEEVKAEVQRFLYYANDVPPKPDFRLGVGLELELLSGDPLRLTRIRSNPENSFAATWTTEVLIAALHDQDPTRCERAVFALGQLRPVAGLPHLRSMLGELLAEPQSTRARLLQRTLYAIEHYAFQQS